MKRSLKGILKISKVLYLDDKNEIPTTVQNSLKLFFNKVLYTNDISSAVAIYNKDKPNIIICDVSLGQVIFDFLEKIREQNYTIPIIITSKNQNEELLLKVIRLQVIDFLHKPIKTDNLIYALNLSAKHILRGEKILVKFGDEIIYDYISKSIKTSNKVIELTKNETILIELLLTNNTKTTSKSEIEFNIWGESCVNDSTFKSLLQRLKTKIGKNIIHNKNGYGYYLSSIVNT